MNKKVPISERWKMHILAFSLLLITRNLFGQSLTINGVVKSSQDNETIPGVSVIVKGSTRGTVTDIDGQYQIEASPGDVLLFSYVGFISFEQPILTGQTIYNISLSTSMSDLSEVVVIGYGSQLKKEVTGAVKSVSGADLMDLPVSQITTKLQGRMAGVQINQTTGRPGAGMNVRIRGQLSVSAGSAPLYVVDGFPITGNIANINPDEIEDITVLKDAASTSMYGSRAANGVVLVTTKKGRAGKTSVDFNMLTGVQYVPKFNRLEMMNAEQFAQFKKEFFEDAGRPVPEFFQNPAQFRNQNNDWFDALLRVAPISNYNLSLTTGTDRSNTSVVASFFDQDGVVLNSTYQRFAIRVNTDYKISDKVTIGVNVAPTFVNDASPPTDGGRNFGLLFNAIHTWPVMPIRDENGELTKFNRFPQEYGNIWAFGNWVRAAEEIENRTRSTSLLSNAFLEYRPIKGLILKSTFNAELFNSNFQFFQPSTSTNILNEPIPAIARFDRSTNDNFGWLNENLAIYTTNIGDHNMEFLAGYTNQYFRNENTRINANTFADDRIPAVQGALNINRPLTTTGVQEWALTSLLSRVLYNYKGKYLFTAAIRSDGSSRFGLDNRWGVFPSVSAGWVMSDENFLEGNKTISFAKIRTSYGIIGNDNIGNYTQHARINNTVNHVFNNQIVPGAAVASLANTRLGWETTRQLDLGLDLGILDDRIEFVYDYYVKNTTNLLFNVPITQESGFASFNDNIGELRFWGHEFSINTINTTGKLKWSTSANISFMRNKVLSLADGIDRIYGSFHITQVGQPFGQFYGLVKLGNYMNEEDLANNPQVPGRSTVGSIKLKDINGDGIITFGGDNDDRTIIGNPFPDFIYGIINNFQYGKWDMSIVGSGSYGNQLYMRHLFSTANLDGVFNMVTRVSDRFRSPDNPGAGIFGTTVGGGNVTGVERDWPNSNFVWDASFFSIQNITIGYNAGKVGKFIESARVFTSIQNVYTWTPYWGGSNPESSMQNDGLSDGGNLSPGVDFLGYPIPRIVTIGANLRF